MIALPIKKNDPDAALAPLFGKAKYFALSQDEAITLWKNSDQSGTAVVEHLLDAGIDTVLFVKMGANPFLMLRQAGIRCFYAGEKRITVQEALKAFHAGSLPEVTPENMLHYIQPGQQHHGHDHHDHAHGHAHH